MARHTISNSLLGLLIGAGFSLAASLAPAAQTAADEAKLKVLRDRIGALQQRMDRTRGEHHTLTSQLRETEQEVGRLARRLRVLDGRLARQHAKLDELRDKERADSLALVAEREALADQVRAAYATGRQERVKLMLNQEDPATLSRVLAYYDYLNRARAARMQRLQQGLAELARTREEIDRETARLVQLQDASNAEKLALEQSQRQRRDVVRALAEDLLSQGREMDQLQRDEQQLTELLRGLREALSDIPPETDAEQRFALRRGKLPWPSQGRLVANYGQAKIGSLRWDGVMISAPEGREVRAVHHGRVAFADWLRGFGLLMIIDHGDGYMTLYGHNQSLFKETGDWVEAGEAIAAVGNSGGRDQPGVYFGIRFKGKPVDPSRWCRRASGSRVG
jgi:septal ring factor EnvC (AmiA/AmiB activator)